ncbi:soluble epoxide hydrolase [Stemphylium lycopersici]|uniref:Soluble epoxide hydrolase n=1 Tax=Stemphylium lycopersici TaxID=183478 RepID=A0A364N9Y7_STELY|nr:soluble epoxide hydrolase [Stemphylium lycopersici]RAR14148.1 soluble epoxide hydrolase [Stemphylium lycopersici]
MNPADQILPCPIGDLPDELLIAIVSHLEIKRGPTVETEAEANRQKENTSTACDIHALTLTCRKLNAIATSALYQCIVSSPKPRRMVKLLLQTLFRRPELCRHIRYIESPGCLTSHNRTRRREMASGYGLTESDSAIYGNYLSNAKWAVDPMDPMIVDLSFEKLHEACKHREAYSFLHAAALCLIAAAPNLAQVVISREPFYKSLLACKRYHPGNGLRTLWIIILGGHPMALRQYNASPSCMDDPIAKLLQYEQNDNHERIKASVEMDAVSLDGEDIGEQAIRRLLDPFVDMDEDIPSFGSLREFTALKHLNVSGLVLFGDCMGLDYPRLSAILPESLETLSIKMEWDDDISDALYNLYEDFPTTFNQLRMVECAWRPAPRTVAELLVAEFKSIGVELILEIDDLLALLPDIQGHIINTLSDAGYCVIAPDYRGAGQSSKPLTSYQKTQMAEELHILIQIHFGIKEEIHVVSHDIGGMIVFAYISRYPEDVASVIWGECQLPSTSFYEDIKGGVDVFHFVFHQAPNIPEFLVGKERGGDKSRIGSISRV